jgi:hypothetical protein
MFPFLLRLRTPDRRAGANRELIIGAALQILLGCVMGRPPDKKVRFTVYIDQDNGKGYVPEDRPQPAIRAMLAEAQRDHPELLRQWVLTDAVVRDSKHDPLIQWCDFLCHTVDRPGYPDRDVYKKWAKVRQWPAYAELSDLEVAPVLRAAVPSKQSTAALLEVLPVLAGCVWGRHILGRWRQFAGEEISHRLLYQLNQQYQASHRDVALLEKKYTLLREHVLTDAVTPSRCKLLYVALEFHYANHRGEPQAVSETAAAYRKIWRRLFAKNPVLVTNINAKLAVHYFDSFRFAEAAEFLADVATCSNEALHPRERGVILSVRGQASALRLQHAEADSFFVQAMREFNLIDDPDQQAQELRQTNVYRLLNLSDWDPAKAMEELARHFSGGLDRAAETIGACAGGSQDYDHYLLRSVPSGSHALPRAFSEYHAQTAGQVSCNVLQMATWSAASVGADRAVPRVAAPRGERQGARVTN